MTIKDTSLSLAFLFLFHQMTSQGENHGYENK